METKFASIVTSPPFPTPPAAVALGNGEGPVKALMMPFRPSHIAAKALQRAGGMAGSKCCT